MTTPTDRKFKTGDRVRKKSGSQWNGRVCGFYHTSLTPYGCCIESELEIGSVQIYPESALALVEECPTDTRAEGEAVSLHDRANYLDDVFKYSSDPMCAFAGQAMREAADLVATLSAQLAEAREDVAAYHKTVAILEAASSRQLAETRKITEAMVEAGARVIAECTRTGIIEAPKLDWPCWMGTSRAIIEAALSPRDADAAAMRTTKS